MACGNPDNADGNALANMVQRGTATKIPAGGEMTLQMREL